MPLSHPWDNDSTIFHYPKPGTMGIVPPIGRTIPIVPGPEQVYNLNCPAFRLLSIIGPPIL